MEMRVREGGPLREGLRGWARVTGACWVVAILAGGLQAAEVTVQVQNLSDTDGFWLSPMWVGFHDGSFDLFDQGAYIKPGGGLERLAEDGNPKPLQAEFAQKEPGGTSGVIEAPGGTGNLIYFAPGETASMRFKVDPVTQRFMSFAAMVMPSNDAFIGNEDPQGIELFSESGWWWGPHLIDIGGCDVWDAGTEWNTMRDAFFLNQESPNEGITTVAGVVHARDLTQYDLFIASAGGQTNDLGVYFDPEAVDFITNNPPVCRIIVIPEPATMVLLAAGGVLLWRGRRRPA